MLSGVVRVYVILLILYASLLLLFFVKTASPIMHLFDKNEYTKEVIIPLKSDQLFNERLLQLLSSSPSLSESSSHIINNISGYKNIQHVLPKKNKWGEYKRRVGRKLLSSQMFLPVASVNRDRAISIYKSGISKKHMTSASETENSSVQNSMTSEQDSSTSQTKDTSSSTIHSSVSVYIPYSGSNYQPLFVTSPLPEVSSTTTSSSSSTIETDLILSNNSMSEVTTISEIVSLHPNSSTETTTDDAPSANKLSSGAIIGLVIAVLAGVTIITGSVIYVLYQKYGKRKKLESKCSSDNCGYVDDTLRNSGYLNSHIELPKESSEEMTSLDNDSFLNSLESMTFQNYWADNTKNTKV